ncbi:MAG: hypothetical protein NTZ80_01200 [Patescibacteria group bacterium]|nr:hypothetical protein [Patescibacteria group bacterium]
MFLFENSADILRLAAAIAILGIGIAGTWFLIYLVLIVKRVYRTIRIFETVMEKIDEYIAKPVAAVSGLIDDIAPIIRFFADRKR